MLPSMNPSGKHRRKRRHHGEGSVIERHDKWRRNPWAAVVPYLDSSGRRREKWLSAPSREAADDLRKAWLRKFAIAPAESFEIGVGRTVRAWLHSSGITPASADRYRQHIDRRIEPTLGDVPLAELTPLQVRNAMNTWTGSPSTIGGTLTVLRAAMRQAVADRLIPDDPTRGVKPPTINEEPPVVLDVPEARLLLEMTRGEPFWAILVTSLGLGLRRGECLGLRTGDVDLAAGTLTVSKSLRRIPPAFRGEGESTRRLVAPKAKSGRTVPLPAFVAQALAEAIEQRATERRAAKLHVRGDYVFADRLGNPISFTSLDRWFHKALVRAGLPDMKWHGLRHSTATMLLAEGVPERTVQAILGHSSGEMTRRYMQVLPRMSREAADRLDKVMG